MKFRFCGGLDAPEWILGEVSTLSKFSSVRMKLLCRQIAAQLAGAEPNYDKISTLTTSKRISWRGGDVKALIAALSFILRNSAKFDVDPDVLPQELEQLGLPGDICRAIGKVFAQNKQLLQTHLSAATLSLPRVTKTEWRVDYLMGSSQGVINAPSIQLNVTTARQFDPASSQTVAFELSHDKFRAFHEELRAISGMLARMD